jgi:hypothetical protein
MVPTIPMPGKPSMITGFRSVTRSVSLISTRKNHHLKAESNRLAYAAAVFMLSLQALAKRNGKRRSFGLIKLETQELSMALSRFEPKIRPSALDDALGENSYPAQLREVNNAILEHAGLPARVKSDLLLMLTYTRQGRRAALRIASATGRGSVAAHEIIKTLLFDPRTHPDLMKIAASAAANMSKKRPYWQRVLNLAAQKMSRTKPNVNERKWMALVWGLGLTETPIVVRHLRMILKRAETKRVSADTIHETIFIAHTLLESENEQARVMARRLLTRSITHPNPLVRRNARAFLQILAKQGDNALLGYLAEHLREE